MMVKIKFENNDKTFEMCLTEDGSQAYQQKLFLENADFDNLETRMMHHLFNPDTNMFILTASEVKPRKLQINLKNDN